jgi:hypothetical protein
MASRARVITVALVAVSLIVAGIAAVSRPAGAQPAAPPAAQATAATGPNLLLNPVGTAGAASAQGWDAVTIPGWQVQAGLPTVVRYGTAGFPKGAGAWPASRGDLFAGGAGGTASLVQVVRGRRLPDGGHGDRLASRSRVRSHDDSRGHLLASGSPGAAA